MNQTLTLQAYAITISDFIPLLEELSEQNFFEAKFEMKQK